MKAPYKGTAFAVCVLLTLLNSRPDEKFEYNFYEYGNRYSFHGRFAVPADYECLINVIYDFEHISQYASDAKSVELIRQGENWYEVVYIYRKLLIFENQSTWRRTRKRDEGRVVFEMISSKNNLGVIPDVTYSTGYYQIGRGKEGYSVEYYQECELKSGVLRSRYINEAKKGAIKFLREFREYILETCN